MPVRKTEDADLKSRYPLYVQMGLVASLVLLLVIFSVDLSAENDFQIVEEQQEIVTVEEIEQTQQIERPPPPPKPPPPVEVPDDEVDDEMELDLDMDLDLDDAPAAPPPPPPPPDEPEPEPEPEPEIFEIVENMPELIGGLESLKPEYPELARRAGIEGNVFVQFVVDENGNVRDPVCVRGPGGGLCDAALAAVSKAKFTPGRQRGKPVKVKYALPVRFKLR